MNLIKKGYFKELGLGYIFISEILVVLFFFVAIIYSSIQVINNYEIKFLNYLKLLLS